jgi:hypothetical protein
MSCVLTYDIVGRTYDGVRYIVHTTPYVRCYIRRWTYDVVGCCNIGGLTYDNVGLTYDVVCLGRCKSYTMS